MHQNNLVLADDSSFRLPPFRGAPCPSWPPVPEGSFWISSGLTSGLFSVEQKNSELQKRGDVEGVAAVAQWAEGESAPAVPGSAL